MSRRRGVRGVVTAALVAAAVVGCARKGARSFRPVDAFGPADADLVVKASPAGIIGSRFYSQAIEAISGMPGSSFPGGKPPEAVLEEEMGVDATDIVELAVCADLGTDEFTIAATTGKPFDRDAALAFMSKGGPKIEKLEAHGGVDLLGAKGEEDTVVAFPTANLVVLGTKDAVRQGIDRLKAGKAAKLGSRMAGALDAAPEGHDLVVAVVATPGLAKTAAGVARLPDVAQKLAFAAMAMKVGDSLDLDVIAEFNTEEDAREAREQATRHIEAEKSRTLEQAEMEPLRALLEGIKIGGEGKVAELTVSVPADAVKALVASRLSRTGGGIP